MFMFGYLSYNIIGGIIGFVSGILIFEFFKYFYGESPDIILYGNDENGEFDKDELIDALKQSFKQAVDEQEEENK